MKKKRKEGGGGRYRLQSPVGARTPTRREREANREQMDIQYVQCT